jgi:hypothetical protein
VSIRFSRRLKSRRLAGPNLIPRQRFRAKERT